MTLWAELNCPSINYDVTSQGHFVTSCRLRAIGDVGREQQTENLAEEQKIGKQLVKALLFNHLQGQPIH